MERMSFSSLPDVPETHIAETSSVDWSALKVAPECPNT